MIHRDIKPANIILNVNGSAILMDFGIVKITGGVEHTATGAVVGTALYMPPELIRGEVPDLRADIYSLGVTLFEMISGRPPFEADSAMSLMMMHMRDPLPNMHHLRPDVPDEMIAVITKALGKEPSERYASMADLSAALKVVLEHLQAGVAAPAPAVEAPGPDAAVMAAAGATLVETPALIPTKDEDRTVPDMQAAAPAAAVGLASDSAEPVGGPAVASSPVTPPNAEVASGSSFASPPGAGEGKKIRPAIWIGAIVIILIVVLGGIGIGMALSGNDGNGGSDFSQFELTVQNINDPPEITNSEIKNATEDKPYKMRLVGHDIDPTDDIFVWEILSDTAWISINRSSGNLTGTPENSDVGKHWVYVKLFDGKGGNAWANYSFSVIKL